MPTLLDPSVFDVSREIGDISAARITVPVRGGCTGWKDRVWSVAQPDLAGDRRNSMAPQLLFSPFKPHEFPFLFGMTIRLLPNPGTLASAASVLQKCGVNILAAELEARGQNHHTLKLIGLDQRLQVSFPDVVNRSPQEIDRSARRQLADDISARLGADVLEIDGALRSAGRGSFLYENSDLIACEHVLLQKLLVAWRDMEGKPMEFSYSAEGAQVLPVREDEFRCFFDAQFGDYGIELDARGLMSFSALERLLFVTVGNSSDDLILDLDRQVDTISSSSIKGKVSRMDPDGPSDYLPRFPRRAKLRGLREEGSKEEWVEVAFGSQRDFRDGVSKLFEKLPHIAYFPRGNFRISVESSVIPELLKAGIKIRPADDRSRGGQGSRER